MRGKKYLWTLLILMFLASMANVSIPTTSPEVPTVTFRVDPPITTGVSPGSLVLVNVSIEADPGAAIVGWRVCLEVDPDVLEPGYEYGGYEFVAWTGTGGYLLYDWCVANDWDPEPGSPPTIGPHDPPPPMPNECVGVVNKTAGTVTNTTEAIKTWTDLGVGVGAEGNGTLVTFYFTSLDQYAWSPITIVEAYYFTSWKGEELDPRVPDFIVNGHYNQPYSYLHSESGLIDLASPVGTSWHELYPTYSTSYHLSNWIDGQASGEPGYGVLSPCDDIQLNTTWYHMEEVTVTAFGENLTSTNSPNSTSGGWTDGEGAYADGSGYAYVESATPSASQYYGGYGFDIPTGATIVQVGVRLDARTDGNEKIHLKVSEDGGTSWLPSEWYTKLGKTEGTYWVNVTGWTSWTPAKINNDNIRTQVWAFTKGNATNVYLDWIPIEVTYITPMYIEFLGGFEYMNAAIANPMGTYWHELYPTFSNRYNLTSWTDTDYSGNLTVSDDIELTDLATGTIKSFHVEDVATDIIVKPKTSESSSSSDESAEGSVQTQASPEPYFTLWAIVPSGNEYWGAYGNYEGILLAIRYELAKIGINLEIREVNKAWWAETIFDYWDVPATAWDGPREGWDVTVGEWWFFPTGLTPLEVFMYKELMPPDGKNIFPWMNEKADGLLHEGMTTLDPYKRQELIGKWQELFVHDLPLINIYYAELHEARGAYVEGWDPVVRFRDVSHLTINIDKFDEVAPPGRKAVGSNKLLYGVAEAFTVPTMGRPARASYVPSSDFFNPLFMSTRAQQIMNLLTHDTLYSLSREPWPDGQFVIKPNLAVDQPDFLGGPNGPNTRVRVPLRQGVKWSDGVPFNATDVKFTFDLVLNSDTEAIASFAVSRVVEGVEIVNETCVDFILHEPYADFMTMLSDEWGLTIVPWHQLKDIPPEQLRRHATNLDVGLEGTGPYIVTNYKADLVAKLDKNDEYFGYDLGWGPDGVERIILTWIPDIATRKLALQTLDIDFGELVVASIETWKDPATWANHIVSTFLYPASNPLWLNLNNPYLANRYIRQAIAHAIPYKKIFEEILPSWGIETAYPGMTLITPLHYYTDENNVTVHLFNEELEPFEYNLEKAQQYMDMWKYSSDTVDWAQGPVGDADQSGIVDFTDWSIWRASPLTGTWPDPTGLIYPMWPFTIDPDWDNDGDADAMDSSLWGGKYGTEYPFPGAR